MASIRKDLIGVVYVGAHVLAAGDTVPDGTTIGDHVLEPTKPAASRSKKTPAKTTAEDTSDGVDDD